MIAVRAWQNRNFASGVFFECFFLTLLSFLLRFLSVLMPLQLAVVWATHCLWLAHQWTVLSFTTFVVLSPSLGGIVLHLGIFLPFLSPFFLYSIVISLSTIKALCQLSRASEGQTLQILKVPVTETWNYFTLTSKKVSIRPILISSTYILCRTIQMPYQLHNITHSS